MQRYSKIRRFFSACDELVDGSYSLADNKISEILKAIASSRELRELFDAATANFDYPSAKRAYLRYPAGGNGAHGAAYLPTERKEILAFVFCVLVELDVGNMTFNDFLLRYFYKDGSYTASFTAFCDRMLRPFRDIVHDCFPDDFAKKEEMELQDRQTEALIGKIAERMREEKARLETSGLKPDDRSAAEIIFSECNAAVVKRDREELRALLTGYRYFLRCVGAEDEKNAALFSLIGQL